MAPEASRRCRSFLAQIVNITGLAPLASASSAAEVWMIALVGLGPCSPYMSTLPLMREQLRVEAVGLPLLAECLPNTQEAQLQSLVLHTKLNVMVHTCKPRTPHMGVGGSEVLT